jgi:hypothetical protein
MPTVLSKLKDLIISNSNSSAISQIQKIVFEIWKIYRNNRTVLGRSIWIFAVYYLYFRKGPKKKIEDSKTVTSSGTKPKSKKVEVNFIWIYINLQCN